MSDLEKRVRTITGAIAKNNLASRFQHGNESPLDMMKRIQSEITSDEIADLWQNKLESMGVVFSHDKIPEGRTLPLSPMGAFCPAKSEKAK